MRPPSAGSDAEDLLTREVSRGVSSCVPLLWVPTWAFSFADSFISSLLPIDELISANLIDEHVLLRPDLWAWPRSKNPIYRMIGALSAQPIRSFREVAPVCNAAAARRARAADGPARGTCAATCYERAILCQFKSAFDEYTPPMAPWRAGQHVAASVLRREERRDGRAAGRARSKAARAAAAGLGGADGAKPLHVVFVNRTRTEFARSFSNLEDLLERCRLNPSLPRHGGRRNGTKLPSRAPRRLLCSAHEFGRGGLARDVRAARAADVLVGTHGAGLANAFFMRSGSALVEVRPYNFEGSWPDKYFRALTALEQRVLYFQVSSGSPALSTPRPKPDVSVWDARDHNVRLPWRTMREVLQAVAAVRGDREKYVRRLWRGETRFVSQEHFT
jgi:hypothetical protein